MDIMRNHFTIELAGLIIEIDSVSPRTCIYCMDYLKEGNPDVKIKIRDEDIKQELLMSKGIKKRDVTLETTAAYRKITEALLDYNIILMHGAVIATKNTAYMFSAPSGTGKTTHIKLWLKNITESYVVNGDKPLIIIKEDKLVACGTPWSGNENMNSNTMVPLKSIVFMKRSEENNIRELSFIQAYPLLVQHTHIPRDTEHAKKTLSLLSKMYKKVTFWQFDCNNFKDDCFQVSYDTLTTLEPDTNVVKRASN